MFTAIWELYVYYVKKKKKVTEHNRDNTALSRF